MRAGGGCMVQQALTFEATSVVKQAIALARRRGHAQVTPLHVASTMLSASNGIFRTACLQSHSHPLQCKALELCFNVELNRLPVSSSSPMLAIPQSPNPTISNALVAAFKRAQAHQRRGSMENQQQPLLAVKVEIEQLIISILDDPSVSRVMREAGFSSTQVKTNIEQVVSSELISTHQHGMASNLKENNLLETINTGKTLVSDPVKEEDVASIFEGLIKKRRNIVVVGECLVNLENVVKEVRNKLEKGGDSDVPEELKDVKFISIPFSSFNNLHNHEVMNTKIQELGHLVRDVYTKGVVLYVGDLKPWMMIDYTNNNTSHVVKELGKLVCGIGGGEEKGKCWLLGIATFATYTKCKSGQYYHLLENRWGLHPITLPTGSLGLSLSTDQSMVTEGDSRSLRAEEETYLSCCAECKDKFGAEARIIQNSVCESDSTFSWLKDESIRLKQNHQNCLPMGELCRKWNSICSTIHKENRSSMEKSSNFSSTAASPSSSLSFFSHDHQQIQDTPSPHPCGNLQFPFWQQPKLTFPPFSNSTQNSRSSSSDIMEIDYYVPRFKQFNSENLHVLCNALEQKVPWQKHILPEISGIILQCRSGMLKRKGNRTNAPDHIRTTTTTTNKEETWLLFHGPDAQAKERIARELAKVVFGSYSSFVSISLSNFSSTRADSNEEGIPNKRRRDEKTYSFIGKIAQAILENPHRVILVEDLMQGDVCSQMGIKRAIESGKIRDSSIDHEEVCLSDAIIILCCESCSSSSRVCSPRSVVKHIPEDRRTTTGDDESASVISPRLNLDLNISFDDDGSVEEDQTVGEMGIVESVDGLIVFRQHELHDDLRLDVTY